MRALCGAEPASRPAQIQAAGQLERQLQRERELPLLRLSVGGGPLETRVARRASLLASGSRSAARIAAACRVPSGLAVAGLWAARRVLDAVWDAVWDAVRDAVPSQRPGKWAAKRIIRSASATAPRPRAAAGLLAACVVPREAAASRSRLLAAPLVRPSCGLLAAVPRQAI